MTRRVLWLPPEMPNVTNTKIRCKRCRGLGKRSQSWSVVYPEEYQNGDPQFEWVPCEVCDGAGEVTLDGEPTRI